MKKVGSIFLAVALSLTTAITPVLNVSAASISSSSYPEALKDSIWFYDANKCGKDVAADNVFSWRSACHTTDGNDIGLDLTGGFHDCGDHIKFGITNGYSASILGWSLYEFKEAFDASGNTTKMLSTLKYFTDYFMRCRESATKYYYHVGDPSDHDYWGPPENQTGSRSTKRYMGAGQGAADVCGLYSGALSLMYLNYKSVDSAYAEKCLTHAKELYALGKSNPGVGNGDAFYSSSDWKDDMAWAAMWLYVIEKNNSYLSDANTWVPEPATNWTICWNDMKLAVAAVGAEATGDSKYKDALDFSLSHWKNGVTTSGGGLKILDSWGTLRYTAAESLLALVYHKLYKDDSSKAFAKSQIDYIMGNNPANMSYIIGFGSNYPKHPHHRAASGYVGWNDWKNPAKNVLTGALVGGPDSGDTYTDLTDKYTCTEVGIDYNAGLVGALAGMVQFYGNLPQNTSTPTPQSPTPTPSNSSFKRGDLNNDNSINAIDYGILKQILLGIPTSVTPNMDAADVNADGKVNSLDFGTLRGYLLGMLKIPQ
ncbi:MAG: Endoglucanase 1 precursor [Firmicutes bacterium ADurb.Bin419]|nr:MAG: Endoglucanase 1 precursor [Firmicutes bacterium ADurb.Bin419]